MKISIITILALLSPFFFFAQNTVSGIVTDNSGKPIFGSGHRFSSKQSGLSRASYYHSRAAPSRNADPNAREPDRQI